MNSATLEYRDLLSKEKSGESVDSAGIRAQLHSASSDDVMAQALRVLLLSPGGEATSADLEFFFGGEREIFAIARAVNGVAKTVRAGLANGRTSNDLLLDCVSRITSMLQHKDSHLVEAGLDAIKTIGGLNPLTEIEPAAAVAECLRLASRIRGR